jgi:hypothetical protein
MPSALSIRLGGQGCQVQLVGAVCDAISGPVTHVSVDDDLFLGGPASGVADLRTTQTVTFLGL